MDQGQFLCPAEEFLARKPKDSFSEDFKEEYDLALGDSGFVSENHLNFTLCIFSFELVSLR